MRFEKPEVVFKDGRGEITDILKKETIEYVTLVKSLKGSTRGNHYHKETHQFNYIVEGKVKLLTQKPGEKVNATIMGKGDLTVTEPNESHAIVALEDSLIMVFTRGIRGGEDYEKDTYRIPTPLQE